MIEPQQVVYKETFKVTCPHCKDKVTVIVERIKGGKTASIEVKHD